MIGKNKKTLLLHSCCGPCSTSVLERLIEEYTVTVFFYNPNITDVEEFEKRVKAQREVIEWMEKKLEVEIKLIVEAQSVEDFYEVCEEEEPSPEGGGRCEECFKFRLLKTGQTGKLNNFDCFTTTLTVSPMKNAEIINSVGREIGKELKLTFLEENFKKKAGYQRSIEISKEIGIYRQHYCGCEYSHGRNSRKLI